jgi:hypothetical protein
MALKSMRGVSATLISDPDYALKAVIPWAAGRLPKL